MYATHLAQLAGLWEVSCLAPQLAQSHVRGAEEMLAQAVRRVHLDQSAFHVGGMIEGGSRAASSQAGAISLGAADKPLHLPRALISFPARLASRWVFRGLVAMECLAWIRAIAAHVKACCALRMLACNTVHGALVHTHKGSNRWWKCAIIQWDFMELHSGLRWQTLPEIEVL